MFPVSHPRYDFVLMFEMLKSRKIHYFVFSTKISEVSNFVPILCDIWHFILSKQSQNYTELQMPPEINTAGKIVDEMANFIMPRNNE